MTLKNIIRFLVFYIVFIACPSYSATYYVDYLRGADTNRGTSKYSPFKHCPGDDKATDITRATILKAGDIVIFRGGVKYNGEIDIDWSGLSEESRIIYDGDSGNYAPKWGIGKAIIDGLNTYVSSFHFTGKRNYITINGFVMRRGAEFYPNYRAVPTVLDGRLIYNVTRANFVTITNNDFSDAGISNADKASGYCIYNSLGSNWDISGNTFTNCGSIALSMGNGSYTKIHHNTITGHNSWGAAITTGIDVTGNEFHDNIMYDINRYYSPSERHGNWLFVFSSASGSMYETKIYNNKFYNSYAPTTVKTSAFIHHSVSGSGTHDGLYIYNNVMFNTDSNGIQAGVFRNYGGSLKNVHIYGNTFYDVRGGGGIQLTNGDGIPERMSNVYIKNNILVSTQFAAQLPLREEMSGVVDVDYNNYYSTRPSNYKFTFSSGATHSLSFVTWETWKAAGYDLHSYGPLSYPMFVNTAISDGFDLSLNPNSPCIRRGYELGVPYDKDYEGKPRGELWDIGAYQY